MKCDGTLDPFAYVYSTDVPYLLYYSHIPVLILVLFFAFFIFFNKGKDVSASILYISNILIAALVASNVLTWVNNSPLIIIFFWQMTKFLYFVIPIVLLYLFYVYIFKRDVSFFTKFGFLFLNFIYGIFLFSSYSMDGFDIFECNLYDVPTVDYIQNISFFLFVIILTTLFFNFLRLPNKKTSRPVATYLYFGIFAFYANLFLIFQISYYLDNYSFELLAYLGLPVFIGLLTFMIVRFKMLNIKLVGAQALIFSLAILTASKLLLDENITNKTITLVTLVLILIIGWLLVRSVKKVDQQKEALEIANREQESLMHFITHQIKGYFTKSRNIFAMAKEGEYGPIPTELSPVIEEGFKSTTEGVQTVQDLLNASNLKKGTVAYNDSLINLADSLNEIIKDSKFNADKKGLILSQKLSSDSISYNGDAIQLKNVFKNLIENAIHYTESGSISVTLQKTTSKIVFSVKDTGIGISPEDMKKLFTEGGRGSDSIKLNVNSTGYGLYIAKKIVKHYGGEILVKSDGKGKGSEFIVELPIK